MSVLMHDIFVYGHGLAGDILKEKESEHELVAGNERRGLEIGDKDRGRKQPICVQSLYILPERNDDLVQIVQLDFDPDSDRASSSDSYSSSSKSSRSRSRSR